MNRFIKTAGLAALGMASVSVANAQEVKPWSVSAALRGFYDDNIYTYPGKTFSGIPLPEIDSFGFEVSPSISYTFNRSQQTSFGVGYFYSLKWYEARDDDRYDHVHQFNAKLSHAFNERFSLDLRESFAMAQEPQVIDSDVLTNPARSEGDNIRNIAGILLSAELVERLSMNLGYNNTFFDYEENAADVRARQATAGVPINGFNSRSALLDRMEHQIRSELTYKFTPQTTGVLGYQFEYRDFSSNNLVDYGAAGAFPGDSRDAVQHFMYAGVRQAWSPQLVASLQGGVMYTRYENETLFDDQWGPYADGSLRWTYTEGSSIQLNATHRRSATDIPNAPDQEATSVTLSWTHLIFTKLTSVVVAQYQHAEYEIVGGPSLADDILLGGANLTFQLNRFAGLELGYTYDRVSSDVAIRSFTRNRVFAGVRLTY
jgi:hypothetical protein